MLTTELEEPMVHLKVNYVRERFLIVIVGYYSFLAWIHCTIKFKEIVGASRNS